MELLHKSDPRSIGNYQLLGRLGAGGSGIVYAARTSDGMEVALKVIRPELADVPGVRAKLQREAVAIKKVAGNRTAQVVEVETKGMYPYIAMELVDGQSLDEFVVNNGVFRGALLSGLFESLIEALRDIHSAGVIHRDLKPSNIIFGHDGLKVLDFGISAIVDEPSLTSDGFVSGTAAWLSPEQVDGKEIQQSSDIFNLGLIMAFAAQGFHAFGEGRSDAIMYRIAHEEPNLSGIPEFLFSTVAKCLSKDPMMRPTIFELTEPDSQDIVLERGGVEAEVLSPQGTRILSAGSLKQKDSDGQPSGKIKLSIVAHRKKIASGVSVLVLLAGLAMLYGQSNDDGSSKYEELFNKVLTAVEQLDAPLEKFAVDREKTRSDFLAAAPSVDGDDGARFWRFVGAYGYQLSRDEAALADDITVSTNRKLTELDAMPIPKISDAETVKSLRNAVDAHYRTWIDEVASYQTAVDTWIDMDNSKSWNTLASEGPNSFSAEISQTWKDLCSRLSENQPTNSKIDYSTRIADVCEI